MHWPDPAQRERIVEIRDNLLARIAEAEREGWLGEVDRTFLYRHADLLGQVDAAQVNPATGRWSVGPRCEPTSPTHMARSPDKPPQIRQLEKKLSELLGEQAWRESGLGAPVDVDQLPPQSAIPCLARSSPVPQRRITEREQQVVDLRGQFEERVQELDAARTANRELIANLNRRAQSN